MAGVNKAILVGNLGQNPEVRYTQDGTAVCNFSMATNRRWKDKEGNPQEKTEWHRVVAWGATGENAGKFLSKGREVYVEGEMRTRSWESKCKCEEDITRYATEVHVGLPGTVIQFLGSGTASKRPESQPGYEKPGGADETSSDNKADAADKTNPMVAIAEDDVPF